MPPDERLRLAALILSELGQTEEATITSLSERNTLHQSIAAYAAEHAGSVDDLDAGLEAVALEHWYDTDQENCP